MTFLNTGTFNYNSLQEGSYRGLKFYIIKDKGRTGGQKSVIHEFVNSGNRQIEYLGENRASYTMELFIDTNDNFSDRDAFIDSLNNKTSVGTLVHPFYGSVNVKNTQYSVVNEFGRAKFDVIFYEADDDTLPAETKNNKSFLDKLRDKLSDSQNEKLTQGLDALKGGYKTFQDGVDKVHDITNEFNRIVNTINYATDEAGDLLNTLNEIDNNIATLLKAPQNLADRFDSLFNNFQNIGSTTRDTFSALTGLFGFGKNDKQQKSITTGNRQINENNKLFNNNIRINNISIAILTSIDLDYENNDELDNVRDLINAEYEKLVELVDEDTLQDLKTLKSYADRILDELAISVPKIKIIEINGIQNLPQIIYTYYGNFSNADEYESRIQQIINLNSFSNINKIQGEIKLLLQ